MVRILAIAAVAFGAASSAWAGFAGCFVEGKTNPDTDCPVGPGQVNPLEGFCKMWRQPGAGGAPETCESKAWYFCQTDLSTCTAPNVRVYNATGREKLAKQMGGAAGQLANGSVNAAEHADVSLQAAQKGADGQMYDPYGALVKPPSTPTGAPAAPPVATAPTAPTPPPAEQKSEPLVRPEPLVDPNVTAGKDFARNMTPLVDLPSSTITRGDRSYTTPGTAFVPPGDAVYSQAYRDQYDKTLKAYEAGGQDPTNAEYQKNFKELNAMAKGTQGSKESVDDQAKAIQAQNKGDDDRPQDSKYLDTGDCSLSSKLDPNDKTMRCGGTRKMIQARETANMIGQIGGAITTQVQGAAAVNTATNAGTQSAALKGAASTQSTAGKTSFVMGAMNMVMGYMSWKAGSQHEENAKTIQQEFQTSNQPSTPAAQASGQLYSSRAKWRENAGEYSGQYDPGASGRRGFAATAVKGSGIDNVGTAMNNQNKEVARQQAILHQFWEAKKADKQDQVTQARWKATIDTQRDTLRKTINTANQQVSQAGQTLSTNASGEQSKVADEAKNSGMFGMLQGAQQAAQGMINISAANQLKDAANQLEDAANNPALTIVPPGQDAFPATDPRAPTVITGNGAPVDQNPASQQQTDPDSGAPPLGTGLPGPTDGTPTGAPPAPGKYVGGGGGAPGGAGGGGMSLGGGSTQAAGPDSGEKGPTAANPYVSGTTPISGGGMVGPPGGGGKEPGLNPADMMAAALGLLKPQEKDPNSQAYANGRGPASQGMGNGLGLPDEDIFKIVEGGYRRQIKAGNIGG